MWFFLSVIVLILVLTYLVKIPTGRDHPTPDDCWKAGIIYVNRGDPSLFVRKRLGIGYTLNFGNPWSWVVLAGIILLIAAPVRFAVSSFGQVLRLRH